MLVVVPEPPGSVVCRAPLVRGSVVIGRMILICRKAQLLPDCGMACGAGHLLVRGQALVLAWNVSREGASATANHLPHNTRRPPLFTHRHRHVRLLLV